MPLYEREEDEKSPDPKYKFDTHTTLRTSSEVRSRNSSPSGFVNKSNNSGGNRRQRIPTSQATPRTNIMVRNDIKFSIFNGNGLENLEKH